MYFFFLIKFFFTVIFTCQGNIHVVMIWNLFTFSWQSCYMYLKVGFLFDCMVCMNGTISNCVNKTWPVLCWYGKWKLFDWTTSILRLDFWIITWHVYDWIGHKHLQAWLFNTCSNFLLRHDIKCDMWRCFDKGHLLFIGS